MSTSASTAVASVSKPSRAPVWVRGFFLGLTILMIGIVLTGFRAYFGHPFLVRPWVVHFHAAIFSGWMLLFLVQVYFIYRKRRDLHIKLGNSGIWYGALLVVVGLMMAAASVPIHLHAGDRSRDELASFLLAPIGDMLLFSILFSIGIWYRKRPDIHKRFMLMATVSLLFAPIGRFPYMEWVFQQGWLAFPLFLFIWLVPVLLGIGYDLWTTRRIHRAYLAGVPIMLIVFSRVFFFDSPGWMRIGRAIVDFLAPVAAR